MIFDLFDRFVECYKTIHRMLCDYVSNVIGLFVEYKTATSLVITEFLLICPSYILMQHPLQYALLLQLTGYGLNN